MGKGSERESLLRSPQSSDDIYDNSDDGILSFGEITLKFVLVFDIILNGLFFLIWLFPISNSNHDIAYDIIAIPLLRMIGVSCMLYFSPEAVHFSSEGGIDILSISFIGLICKIFSWIYHYNPSEPAHYFFWAYIIVGFIVTAIASECAKKIIGKKIDPSVGSMDDNKMIQNSSTKTNRLCGLEALRFFSSIHIILVHFYVDEGSDLWRRFASWGGCQLTFFFVLSGFILVYSYGERCSTIDTSDFWFKRFARLYPPYVLSIALMCLLLPRDQIDPTALILLLFGLTTWSPEYFINNINTPGWSVGAFLFLYLIFPMACIIITNTR